MSSEKMIDFAQRLKDARKAAGISQQAMADEMLIPKRTIEKWEIGERIPPDYVQRFVLKELVSPVIENDLLVADDDIRDHLEAVKGAGVSVQSYIKELIRADIARVAEANKMLHRMQEDLQSGKISGVICSENGKAAIEHPAIIDRETYGAAQAVMKARKDNPPPPRGYKWQDGELVIEESEAELVRSEIDKYVRASSSSQREESIENQFQDCQEYAQRSGFITADDHVDK